MIQSYEKQPRINILPAFGGRGLKRGETDLDDVVRAIEGALPRHVKGDIDVTITLLEKNLKVMADVGLMREALTRLIKNAIDAMPDYGKRSLTVDEVNFEIESLLNVDGSIIGACAFIFLSGGDAGIGPGQKTRAKMFVEPFFTAKKDGNDLGLAIAYRIINRHHERAMAGHRAISQGTEVNLYLPLTGAEIVSMMSIPIRESGGRFH